VASAAGADIVETDTFTATSIALADFGLEHHVREINVVAALCARRAADRAEREDGRGCLRRTVATPRVMLRDRPAQRRMFVTLVRAALQR